MLQRIQSIWLLLAAAFDAITFRFPFYSGDWERDTIAAVVDLNAKTATKISNDYEAGLDFGQYQNLAVSGDYIYVPLTPTGEAGRLYVINWKTKAVIKGMTLTGQSGSSYLGSY